MMASRRYSHRVRHDVLYVKYKILSVTSKMGEVPFCERRRRSGSSASPPVPKRWPAVAFPHVVMACASPAGTLILFFSWVVSLHATVASSGLNRRTHLGRYSLKRDESTVALRAASDCQRRAGRGVEVHGRALGNFRRSQ